jgi:hypothetical protein
MALRAPEIPLLNAHDFRAHSLAINFFPMKRVSFRRRYGVGGTSSRRRRRDSGFCS